ncbi:uncharacterized protein LY89DRAFT_723874 [Mollisia scopiformis]|uniref:Uncharacterized protein n=1 Tax=Mollisia scopiformis TaxID=149040 RepID=A0A132BCU5_MOLSC|nr:uncharacterized protein LY89DRAFT_723874 [Mollisia scopiformis]KUJ10073.1 hypothetical protein LY89DRAFT_723874 [Mollisia scopiformis]
MTSLLSLPRELRDQIFDIFVAARNERPKDIESIQTRQYTYTEHILNQVKVDCIHHNRRNIGLVSLLLANKQLNAETKDAFERFEGRGKYELDIFVTGEREFWPTWIYLPKRTNIMEELHITFRVFEGEDFWLRASGSKPINYIGGWAFFHLLERLLKEGPRAVCAHGSSKHSSTITERTLSWAEALRGKAPALDQSLRIRKLYLHFETGFEGDFKEYIGMDCLRLDEMQRLGSRSKGTDCKTPGGRLAAAFSTEITDIMQNRWADLETWLDRIGSIWSHFDDRPLFSYDFAKRLSELAVLNGRGHPEIDPLYRSRVKFGLGVIKLGQFWK